LPTNETLLKNIKGRKINEEVPIEVEYTAEFKRKRLAGYSSWLSPYTQTIMPNGVMFFLERCTADAPSSGSIWSIQA
jgi:hypothetical protein